MILYSHLIIKSRGVESITAMKMGCEEKIIQYKKSITLEFELN